MRDDDRGDAQVTVRARAWDIAVIGMACRFPGAATPRAFWDNLLRGTESITFFSDDELVAAGEDPTLLANPTYVKAAPILAGHDEFDAAFFGYSPREARLMDPQHRLFLEVAWEAFEDAGYDPLGDKGVVSVYAGAGGLVSSYMVRLCHPELRGQTGDLGHIGNDRDFLCSRVSFKLNLTGPSINVQSACSTSVLAVHLACRGLLDGEADMALAGASVVRVPHIRGYLAEPGNIYSLDGHCRPFDAQATGTLFGSGVAAVLLKPLAAAVADGDQIYAVIKGAAINNDGAQKVAYTASTASGQARAATDALAIAQIDPADIGYVECHGTGTALGDPVEVQALTRAFRTPGSRARACAIGSVKSNVGHLEQCAGMAGLIKAILALRHDLIPPSLHFATPNPRIPFERSPFHVNTAVRPFDGGTGPRRAGVNSVGMGGTNGFLVLEEAPSAAVRGPRTRPTFSVPLSAQTADGLSAHAGAVRDALAAPKSAELRDIAFTASHGRHHFGHRFVAAGGDASELRAELDRCARGATGSARTVTRREPVVFLFPGQGAQYARMGESLQVEPAFRDVLDRCLALFTAADVPVADALFGDDGGRLQQTLYAQPALFSLQVALAELWKAWGIVPDAVIGHSIGEFAAAVIAGVCSLEDAARLVAARARLMDELSDRGTMVSIGADLDVVHDAWPAGDADLAVAAINAPGRTVVSGRTAAVATLVAALQERGVPTMKIDTAHAFHSPLMGPVLGPFERIAGTVAFGPPRVRWISTLTGDGVREAPDARYWREQIRQPVRFRTAIEAAARLPAVFLEVGPGATLIGLGRRCVQHMPPAHAWVPSLTREAGDWPSLLDAVRHLYVRGQPIRACAFEPAGGRRVSLPTYPFRRDRWWLESRESQAVHVPAPTTVAHPLLGERRSGQDLRFEAVLDVDRLTVLRDHRVFRHFVLPTTAVLEAVIAAAREGLGLSRLAITGLVYERAVTVPPDRPTSLRVALERDGRRRANFRLESRNIGDASPWDTHVTGTIGDADGGGEPPPFPSDAVRSGLAEIPVDRFYAFLARTGLGYGPAFRGIARLWRGDDEAFARVILPADIETDGYIVHPAFLDACLHLYMAVVRKFGLFDSAGTTQSTYVPVAVGSFHLFRSAVRSGWAHAVVLSTTGGEARIHLDIRVYTDDGEAAALFHDVTIRETTEARFGSPPTASLPQVCYRLAWADVDSSEPSASGVRHWCIVADRGGVGVHLAKRLLAAGATVDVVTASEDLAVMASAVEEMLGCAPHVPVGVVYVGALDLPPTDAERTAPSVQTHSLAGLACIEVLGAMDRARHRFPIAPRLWIVTRGAQADRANEPRPGLAQSPLWGLGRTIALEYPDLFGGLIDVSAAANSGPAVELLAAELLAPCGEDQLLLRPGRRQAPRLVRVAPDAIPPRRRLRADATYWITGGLGEVGLKVARALIEAGAGHLLLTSRRPPSERDATAVQALRDRANVVLRQSDVSLEEDVAALLTDIRCEMPPLRGIVHAAAVFDDAVVGKVTPEQLHRVWRPKVEGAWLLSRAAWDVELDFFVLFSSVLSLWGGAGQAAYTAANSFLDALALARRAAGLPATVFNWGPWAESGLSERLGKTSAALWRQRGTAPLSPEVCIDAMLRFTDGDLTQVAVCDTSWTEFLSQRPGVPSLFRALAPAEHRPPDVHVAAPAAPPRERVLEIVRSHVSQVLGVDGSISLTQSLGELGLDSLLAVNLANRLRQSLQVPVATAMLLKGPSITTLANELFPETPSAEPSPETPGDSSVRTEGNGWLIFPASRPDAAVRLFCFPFAGGGAATFRPWTRLLDRRVELVGIEPPGRQTRIDEPPIRDLSIFVERLVPAMLPFLDKPFAVFGHCLGALTLFETVRTLIIEHGIAPIHAFVSGARPPDELQRHQAFETKLLERLLPMSGFSVFEPIHRQPDDVFAEAILQFNVLETASFLDNPELRRLILPVTRAEFEMSSHYRYTPAEAWDVPLTCLTGIHDSYVTAENARSWGRFTRQRFQLFMIDTEHFLVVDHSSFLIAVLNRELTIPF